MNKLPTLLIIFLLIPLATAQTLYDSDSLELELQVTGEFDLQTTGPNARIDETTAQLFITPSSNFRQEVLEFTTQGTQEEEYIAFKWQDNVIEEKQFGYTATIATANKRNQVRSQLPFPVPQAKLTNHEQYLAPTKTIDSNNPQIIAQATQLVDGETDLFRATFKLASWVEDNVDYELNSVTETASQKASWVLENRQGVCDEMTTLFIAMARSVGIPARFATGISYSTSELFNYPWQPHGWAEVYFPDVGWVGFDITFGEYGYIDVTHIKFRDSIDPQEPATKFEWVSHNVQLESSPLDFKMSIKDQGRPLPDEIQLDLEILDESVGFGSYNLLKGVLTNTANYYVATTLQLAVPGEVDITSSNKRTILLGPRETRETFWVVKVHDNLDQGFWYKFPSLVYSEKNETTQSFFSAKVDETIYTLSEIEKLTVQDEDKVYSRQVSFSCPNNLQIKLNENQEVSCILKNQGNANLYDVEYCINKICETIDLPINQEHSSSIYVQADVVGEHKILLSAKNEKIEKTGSLVYLVKDDPNIEVSLDVPSQLIYGQDFDFAINLEKNSYTTPRNIKVELQGTWFSNTWTIERIDAVHNLILNIENPRLATSNTFTVITTFQDDQENIFTNTQQVTVPGEANGILDTIKLYFTTIVSKFTV